MSQMQSPDIEVFALKVEAVWSVIDKQYAGRMTSAELDHLFACFVLGLTTPQFAKENPGSHYEICHALVSAKLTPERTEAALRSVPPASQPWIESARTLIESKGERVGSALSQRANVTEEPAGEDANSSALERLVKSEETQ
ncbi:hypothetical protein [Phyllobacterium sp. YR531]|uniref:hypothetical protein n=1 Tax=Phyllobacterium sp. YR531 TaxID=1144343 RepID=UPI0002F69B4A|nr:hypothetical protein [Phyllobacterium sp. YR531]